VKLEEQVKRFREGQHKAYPNASDYELEMGCLRVIPFGHFLKGEFCLSLMQMQWPGLLYLEKDGVHNHWFTRGIRTMARHRKNYLVGSASAGKSFMAGAFVYTNWKCSAWNSSALLSSTSKPDLDQKIWGTVKDLFERDKFKIGTRLDYRETIVLREDKKNAEKDYRDAIIALAIPKGSEGEKAIGSIQGRKNQFVYWVSDEYAHMDGAAIQEGRRNLMFNPFFWFAACSNKPNEGDPMYLEAEPDPAKFPQGWDTPGLDQLESWPTKGGGICMYFDGEKSPNLQVEGPPPFPLLTTRESINDIIADEGGTDGPSYWRWIRAFPKKGDIQDKVLTSELLIAYGATEEVVWRGDGWTTLAGLDLGFRKDGDPSVADFGRLGFDYEGRKVLSVEADAVTLVPKMSDPGPHEDKIARRFLEECQKRQCHSVALDISGDGGITALSIRKLSTELKFELEIVPVSFSGAASDDIYDIAGVKKEGRFAFDRRVSELWYSLRLIVQDRSIRGMVLNSKAVNELCQRRVIQDEKKRWVVEKKEDMKKRSKRSPDNGDARVLLVYNARKKGLEKGTVKRTVVIEDSAPAAPRSAYAQDRPQRRAYSVR